MRNRSRTRTGEVEDALHIRGRADEPELPTVRARCRVGFEHHMQPVESRNVTPLKSSTTRFDLAIEPSSCSRIWPTVSRSTAPNKQT